MDRMERIKRNLSYMGSGSRKSDSVDDSKLLQMKADAYNRAEGFADVGDGLPCAICNNKGTVATVETDNGSSRIVFKDCRCSVQRRCIRKMRQSGLKNIIRDYTFNKFDASEPWQAGIKDSAQAYANEKTGWFFIGGQSGAGKTHICSAICRKFLWDGMEVIYFPWRDDSTRLKSLVNDAEAYRKAIDQLKNAQVLFIDDLFKTGRAADGTRQKPTGADINLAFEILNYRYNCPALLTVISSECTANDILEIDEAVGGRILEKARRAINLKPDRSRNYRLKSVMEF